MKIMFSVENMIPMGLRIQTLAGKAVESPVETTLETKICIKCINVPNFTVYVRVHNNYRTTI
jgi:hypothetical protein